MKVTENSGLDPTGIASGSIALEKGILMLYREMWERIVKYYSIYHQTHKLLNRIDKKRFSHITNRYKGDFSKQSYTKYLNLKKYLHRAVVRVYQLDLPSENSLDILDIGTGTGYFPYVCEYFGHHCYCIDVDDIDMYNQITKYLQLRRVVHEIKALELLPVLPKRFDIITAHATNFNKYTRFLHCDAWGVQEWTFFMEDLRNNQLKKLGRIHLQINAGKDNIYFSEAVQSYFKEIGYVQGSTINCQISEEGEWK